MLQRAQLACHPGVAAMPNRGEIVRIKLGEQRIRNAQLRVVDAEVAFQQLLARIKFFQSLANHFARAVVTAKIDKRLFAFEHGSASGAVWLRSVGRDIDAIAAARQAHLECASGVALRLRPNQRETFKTAMSFRFAARRCSGRCAACMCATFAADTTATAGVHANHSRVHCANAPFSAAALTIAYSPLT